MRSTAITMTGANSSNGLKLSCLLLGHQAANRCECMAEPFAEAPGVRHIRHVLSCFLGGHKFERFAARGGHHEYICYGCGHQLLVTSANDPWIARHSFWKRPRYLCSIFGHRVREIGERSGFFEYVCDCGHSFLKQRRDLKRIKHPLTCTVLGHFVRFFGRRDGHSEYLCAVCGHTFCYPLEPRERAADYANYADAVSDPSAQSA